MTSPWDGRSRAPRRVGLAVITMGFAVSRVIVRAAESRENSRGAHFRSDFPGEGDLATSTFTRVRTAAEDLQVEAAPVRFTRVRPGESLLQ